MIRKSKIDNGMIQQAYELASKGFNNKQIYETIKISKSSLYASMDLMDSIKKGNSELRTKLSDAILKNAVELDNPTTQIFLAKRLNLFENTMDKAITIKKSDDILKAVSSIFIAVSDGSLNDDRSKLLLSVIDSYSKAYELNNLEERLEILENKQ